MKKDAEVKGDALKEWITGMVIPESTDSRGARYECHVLVTSCGARARDVLARIDALTDMLAAVLDKSGGDIRRPIVVESIQPRSALGEDLDALQGYMLTANEKLDRIMCRLCL